MSRPVKLGKASIQFTQVVLVTEVGKNIGSEGNLIIEVGVLIINGLQIFKHLLVIGDGILTFLDSPDVVFFELIRPGRVSHRFRESCIETLVPSQVVLVESNLLSHLITEAGGTVHLKTSEGVGVNYLGDHPFHSPLLTGLTGGQGEDTDDGNDDGDELLHIP